MDSDRQQPRAFRPGKIHLTLNRQVKTERSALCVPVCLYLKEYALFHWSLLGNLKQIHCSVQAQRNQVRQRSSILVGKDTKSNSSVLSVFTEIAT